MHMMMIVPSLNLGGAERVAATLANCFVAKGHEITFALLVDEQTPRLFHLDPRVRVVCLDIFRVPDGWADRLAGIVRRNAAIRRAFRQASPDVLLSVTDTTNVRALLAAAGLDIPVVVLELTDPLHYSIGWLWRGLQPLLYGRAAAVVVQTQAMADYYARFVPRRRLHIFFNPIDFPQEITSGARGQDIVYVGRLAPEKNIPLLFEAFAACPNAGWRLLLTGSGPEREALERLAGRLGIAGSVHFLGYVPEVFPVLAQAAFCVLPSLFEGLPNALCEALVMGTPCVATATSGAKAVIRHGENGLLCPVNDAKALAEAMTRLMTDGPLRAEMGEKALALRRDVSLDAVMTRWSGLLHQVAARPGSTGRG